MMSHVTHVRNVKPCILGSHVDIHTCTRAGTCPPCTFVVFVLIGRCDGITNQRRKMF